MSKNAIATTLIRSNHVIDSFIRYHQSIGFDYLFLFFDDPVEALQFNSDVYQNVFIIPYDDNLMRKWMATKLYRDRKDLSDYISSEVMARQILNIQVAIEMCRDLNVEWLLHIDIDELFYSPTQPVREHFADLEAKKIANVSYYNYEAAPSSFEVNDYFRDVRMFKKNPSLLSKFQNNHVKQFNRYQQGKQFFLYYQNGKSAAKITNSLEPKDVHSFYSSAQALFSRTCFILHYPVCGFENFVKKYRELDLFDDKWFGTFPINLPFHLTARDVNRGSDVQQIDDFFRNHVLYTDKEEIKQLLEAGLLVEISKPSEILGGIDTQPSLTSGK